MDEEADAKMKKITEKRERLTALEKRLRATQQTCKICETFEKYEMRNM